MNNTTLIALGLVGVAGYIYYKEQLAKKPAPAQIPAGGSATIPATKTSAPVVIPASSEDYGFPLVYGKYNEHAKFLQQLLGVTQDGIIGPNTLAAIRQHIPDFPQNFQITDQAHLQDVINAIQGLALSSPTNIQMWNVGLN